MFIERKQNILYNQGDSMKKIFLLILAFTFVIAACFGINAVSDRSVESNKTVYTSRNTVVIDAGHGGKDAGTSGVDGALEKDVNLNIALSLYDFLMVSGINTLLTRDGDYEMYSDGEIRDHSDLYNRMDFINSVPSSILISIHQNHFEDEKEWGTQIWYSANTELSKTLADNILKNIKDNLQPENNRLNKASDDSYYLLYKASVPSIMVECGFMSNIDENKKLQDSEYQNDIAYSILTGISGEV